MKILILTQNAPLYLSEFLDHFISIIPSSCKIEGLISLSPIFSKNAYQEFTARLALYGYKDTLKMVLHILKTKVSGYFQPWFSTKCYSLENLSRKHQINKLTFTDLNSRTFHEYIKDNNIDLLISIACPKILKSKTIHLSKYGTINYHTGKLPKYRGRQPMFWAMLHEEKEIGISVHEMEEKIDAGPIIAQKSIPIDETKDLHSIYKKTIEIGPKVLLEAIQKILNKDTSRLPNTDSQKSYFSFPKKEDGIKFRKKGFRYYK